MKVITVNASKNYDVIIDTGLLECAGVLLAHKTAPCKAAVITDDIVDGLYAGRLCKSLENTGFETCKYVFKNGEQSKNAAVYMDILEFLAENRLTRGDLLIALGGGVVGDITGFAAASYLRGIDFIQIPTTFLSAIDSSVGGKTGINLNAGKNLAGAFWQPSMVICDYSTLKTLPEGVFAQGIAEAVKYGMIASAKLFSTLNEKDIFENIEQIIAECVKIKRDIVNRDEFDRGERQLLNFGHTLGHAIEKLSGYEITHGEAVAIGMCVISRAAFKAGLSETDCSEPLRALLKKHNLPTECGFSAEQLCDAALSDKKRSGGHINLVAPKRIGSCFLHNINIDGLLDFVSLGF